MQITSYQEILDSSKGYREQYHRTKVILLIPYLLLNILRNIQTSQMRTFQTIPRPNQKLLWMMEIHPKDSKSLNDNDSNKDTVPDVPEASTSMPETVNEPPVLRRSTRRRIPK